jgi:predicted HTH domain antitoxin
MTVTVDLPESAIKALSANTEKDAVAKLRLAAAMKLHELGHLSSGAAAELAGVTKIEFLERMSEYGVLAIPQTPAEAEEDLRTLRDPRTRG